MQTEETTLLIADKLCERVGVSLAWKPINELGIFAYQRKHSAAPDKPSQHYPTSEASVFNIRQDVVLFRPVLRKIINEANGIFLNLQNLVLSKRHNANFGLLQFSRQYRSIIRASLENLQEDLLKAKNDTERGEIQQFITIFYSVECIWHLCEILFIDVTPGNIVLPHLQEWIRFHFPKYEKNAAEMLCQEVVGLEMNADYWPTIIGSLMQGRVDIARGLLKQHSSSDTRPFLIADQCLKAMPAFNVYSGLSAQEYHLQWHHWRVDVESKIDARAFSSDKNLEFIMKMVVKDELAWAEIQQQCETWYEMLPAWLFYSDPTVKSFELGNFAKYCIKQMSMDNKLNHLDKVLLAAMEYDLLEVIKEIQKMSENGWFATHLTNLLYHSGQLTILEKDIDKFSGKKLQDSLILDYGTLLIGHKSLWQVGLSYLDHCSKDGLRAIELLLPRLPLDNELKTQKILREAQKRNLVSVEKAICKAQAMKYMNRNRLGSALTWALKSNDKIFVSLLSEKFLKEYTNKGRLMHPDLLLSLGPSALSSNRLLIATQYYEFYTLYKQGRLREAGFILMKLIQSTFTPKFFLPILLVEAIPLMESEDIIFSVSDTHALLSCLEHFDIDKSFKDKIDILRFASARNLSRALLHEAITRSHC